MSEIRLEPLAERHLPALEALIQDPGVLRYTLVPDPPPPGFAATWLQRYEEGRRNGTREAFAIEDQGGAFLGLALAFEIERDAGELELGYVVAPEARGRGVAVAALALLTDWALAELGAQRIELQISDDNEASQRVARRCGYVYEGTLRSTHFKQGRRENLQVWSRLATD